MTIESERYLMFEAVRDVSGDFTTSSGATIAPFDRMVVNTNPGVFDLTTGVFTAPFSGTYSFYLEGETRDDASDTFISWNMNGVQQEQIQIDEGQQHNYPFTNSITLTMNTGDKLLAFMSAGGGVSCQQGLYHLHFGGKLVY